MSRFTKLRKAAFFILSNLFLKIRFTLSPGKLKLSIRNNRVRSSRFQIKAGGSVELQGMVHCAGRGHFAVSEGQSIQIGSNTSINYNCSLYGHVTIGSGCLLADNIYISSLDHQIMKSPAMPVKAQDRLYPKPSKPVYIEEDCWVGRNVFIGQGVYIPRGCVIAANSMIRKTIEKPYSIVGGTKQQVLKSRLEFVPPAALSASTDHIPYFYRGFEFEFLSNQTKVVLKRGEVGVIVMAKMNTSGFRLFVEGSEPDGQFSLNGASVKRNKDGIFKVVNEKGGLFDSEKAFFRSLPFFENLNLIFIKPVETIRIMEVELV